MTSTELTITTNAPADPETVTEYGDALAELVRALNHVTRHHEAMGYPSDADRLIRNVETAVARLPQMLQQVAGWLAEEHADGRIRMAAGAEFTQTALAVLAVEAKLKKAEAHAEAFRRMLAEAASVMSGMAARDDGTGEGSGEDA